MTASLPDNAVAVATLAIDEICKSPTNPRRRFDEKYLAELAITIKDHGVIQPITVRPNPKGKPLYEIVVGECRWRASKLAGLAEIPAFWRELTDKQVLEIQVIENLQRRDVHPLEEAEGYEHLMKDHGYTAESLGDKVGKSKAYIYARLKLLALCEPARKAFFEAALNPSTALLVARIPDEKLQIQATKEIAQGMYNQGAMSVRQAEEHIQTRYMLKLAEAPFSRTDAALLPAAGACKECPKRTGNQADLFADVKSADVCTDPGCFQAKKEAHIKRQQELAKAEGRKVITGEAAKKLLPNVYSDLKGDYVELDKQVWIDGQRKTVREVLGKDAPPADLLMNPHRKGEAIEVVSKATIKEKLEAKGTKAAEKVLEEIAPQRAKKSDAEKAAERKVKQDATFRQRLFDQLRSRLLVEIEDAANEAPYLEAEEEVMVAEVMFDRMQWEDQKRVAKLWLGPEDEKGDDHKLVHAFQKRIGNMQRRNLARLFMDMVMIGEVYIPSYSNATPDRMLALAKNMAIDTAAMKTQIIAEDREKAKPKGKAAKKVQTQTALSSDAPFQIGDRVRVKNDVRGANGKQRKCCGREGTIESSQGDGAYYAVRFKPGRDGLITNLVWNELEKLPSPSSAENSGTTSTPPGAARAGEGSATTPAAPASDNTAEEIKNPAPAAPASGKGKVAVRYRHPDDSQLCWTGRGMKPNWVKGWLTAHPTQTIADLEIKTTPAPSSTANEPAETSEDPAAASAAPVEKHPPLAPWPFPSGNRPAATA